MFVRAERLAELEAMPADDREAFCAARVKNWRTHDPLTKVDSPDEYGGDPRGEPFTLTVMRASAAAFGTDDAKARKVLVDQLDRWAKAKALSKFDEYDESNFYVVERLLLPTIVGWNLVRDDPSVDPGDRRRIERWLERTKSFWVRKGERANEPRADLNNHAILAASVDMAWGAMVGDSADFGKGLDAYRRVIGQLRPDGSLPLEVRRGSRALWYQRHAIASLIAIAEMAAVQDIDLYGYSVDGRDIHTAIGFLLAGIDDQRLVWPYAEENYNPGPSQNWRVQDFGFLRKRGHGRHYMAWIEAYIRRFPDRPEALQLRQVLQDEPGKWRPMVDDYSGGDTTCFFALPQSPTD